MGVFPTCHTNRENLDEESGYLADTPHSGMAEGDA